jgi:hypothetical protein
VGDKDTPDEEPPMEEEGGKEDSPDGELHMEEGGGEYSPDEEPQMEESRRISLADLAETDHPCLADGVFSILHSPEVVVSDPKDVGYYMDLDGLLILSK